VYGIEPSLIDLFDKDEIGPLPRFQAQQVIVHKIAPEADGKSQLVAAHDQIARLDPGAQEIYSREILPMIRISPYAVNHAAQLDYEHASQAQCN